MPPENLPHILITNPPETSLYTTTSRGGGDSSIPDRDRIRHGRALQERLNLAWRQAEEEQVVSEVTRNGVYLEFKGDPGSELTIKSLENIPRKIRLLNVRQLWEQEEQEEEQEQGRITTLATVFVPHAHKNHFLSKLEEYLQEESSSGNPRNADLVDSIADVRKALLVDSFWCDSPELQPEDELEWIEVWLSTSDDELIAKFDELLVEQQIRSKESVIRFPERAVKAINANRHQLENLTRNFDHIAEYRRAKSSAVEWMQLDNLEQSEFVEDLLQRSVLKDESNTVISILDTGINNGHPLIQPVLSNDDCHSVDPSWGTHDHDKHGTLMAGIAAYGDIPAALNSPGVVELTHLLESVKILPPPPAHNTPDLWGFMTSQAVSRVEIQAPGRNRCICMAVNAADTRDRGRPSSWSAALDQITSGVDDEIQRLFLVSAGNATADILNAATNYPDIQLSDSVHDPAQSWNALTVGAYTQLDQITDATLAGYNPVASRNCLSPFSTTSATWEENKWPVKPELVLEGGNLAVDNTGFATECDDLSLLSTYYNPQRANFHNFNMTSAATAKLSWMSANLQALNPEFWPETIRALLIHSASWTDELKQQFMADESKTSYKRLLSICGYGVPDLDSAMYSAQNSLTLIAQSTIQPFDKKPKGTSGYMTKDMHLYDLPWPKEVLLGLPDDTPVQMRITLSYFVEPGPGEVGWKDRYRYASHGLRFSLNSPGESKDEFEKRVNKKAREADEGSPGTKSPSDHWVIGSQARDRGSIHSDIWQGTAANLADSNLIAVTPTIGWWRERGYLGCWNKSTRYSLIVSIYTPDESVDVYTPVAVQVQTPIAIEVPT